MIVPQSVANRLPDPHAAQLLGVKISGLDAEETVDFVQALVESGESHQVCTVHALGLLEADRDSDLKSIFNQASLVVCDGEGIRHVLQKRRATVYKFPGVELAESLCMIGAERGWRVFFYGGEPGVAERASEALAEKYPRLVVVGALDGFHGAEDVGARLAHIKSMGVDLLLVGMGIPLQEKVAFRAQQIGAARVCMGVGGTFDVISGRRRRAPRWVRGLRLEWLWRGLIDPRKFPKLVGLPVFLWKVSRDR